MSDASGGSGFRRFLSWCFWIILIALLAGVVVALAGRGIFVHYSDRAWARAVADVDAVDPDWRWEQVEEKRAKIPDEENSALVLVRLRESGLFKEPTSSQPKFDFEPNPRQDPDAQHPPAELLPMPDEVPEEHIGERIFNLPPEARLSSAEVRALRHELRGQDRAIAMALKLADMPTGRHPITVTSDFISTMLPTVQYCRSVAYLMGMEAVRRAEAGDSSGALRCVRACLNAARSTGDEPFLITMLVRIAIDAVAVQRLERVLAQGTLTEPELAAMQAALEDEAAVPRLLYGLRGERAGMIKLCEALIRGEVDAGALAGSQASKLDRSAAGLTGDLLARQARPEMLRLFTEMIDIAQGPTPSWEPALDALDMRIKDGAILTRLLMPAVMKVAQAEIRCQAMLHAASVGLAAERFRLTRSRWPNELRELVDAGYLKQAPTDPFTGEPLRLVRRPFGIVAYSVGSDRVDNGGEPPGWRGRTIGDQLFRVYDPRLRRATSEPLPPPRLAAN